MLLQSGGSYNATENVSFLFVAINTFDYFVNNRCLSNRSSGNKIWWHSQERLRANWYRMPAALWNNSITNNSRFEWDRVWILLWWIIVDEESAYQCLFRWARYRWFAQARHNNFVCDSETRLNRLQDSSLLVFKCCAAKIHRFPLALVKCNPNESTGLQCMYLLLTVAYRITVFQLAIVFETFWISRCPTKPLSSQLVLITISPLKKYVCDASMRNNIA